MTNLLLACLSFFAKEVFASLVLSDYTGASCQWWTGDVAHHPELAPLDSESYGHGDSTGSLSTMASPTKSSGSHVNTTSHPQTPCLACGTLLSQTRTSRSAAEESKQLILGQMGHKARIRFPKLVGDMELFTHGLMGSYIQHWVACLPNTSHHWHFHGCMVWRHICILAGQDWFKCCGRHVPEQCLDWRFLHNMFPIL
jgi:hypothetical protein